MALSNRQKYRFFRGVNYWKGLFKRRRKLYSHVSFTGDWSRK